MDDHTRECWTADPDIEPLALAAHKLFQDRLTAMGLSVVHYDVHARSMRQLIRKLLMVRSEFAWFLEARLPQCMLGAALHHQFKRIELMHPQDLSPVVCQVEAAKARKHVHQRYMVEMRLLQQRLDLYPDKTRQVLEDRALQISPVLRWWAATRFGFTDLAQAYADAADCEMRWYPAAREQFGAGA